MKGIVLAGGTGSRLWPVTRVVSKQLLPIYDKPLIYYPLSTLMLAGIREIMIITNYQDQNLFETLLGNGERFGISLTYKIQEEPKGIAEAFIIGQDFICNDNVALILGDNIFYGAGLADSISFENYKNGCHIFVYEVSKPESYGVLELDRNGVPISIEEKPSLPKSKLAITGLYYFDSEVTNYVKTITPSQRGELEITSLLNIYRSKNNLRYTKFSRGTAWLDTGTPESMSDAAQFVKVIEERTGAKIGCLEEIALRKKWINAEYLKVQAQVFKNNSYGQYLDNLINKYGALN